MKVLILGGSGMLGHKLWQTLEPRFDTTATFRRLPESALPVFDRSRVIEGCLPINSTLSLMRSRKFNLK